jgi:hypothetical protein
LRFIHWLKLEPGAVFASTAPACCTNIPMAEYRQISVRVDEDFLKLIDAWRRKLDDEAGSHPAASRAGAEGKGEKASAVRT